MSASSALSSQSVRSDGTQPTGAHQTIPPIHAVYRIVFRVSGVEEPQHAFESPGGVRRDWKLAPIFLVSGRPVGRVDREPRGHTDRIGAALKCAHTRGKAPWLQPIVGADPAKECAARHLEHTVHVLVRTDIDLIDAQPDAPVGTRVVLERLDRPIIRDVVADDEFEIGEVLGKNRFDAPLDDIPPFRRPSRSKALESFRSSDLCPDQRREVTSGLEGASILAFQMSFSVLRAVRNINGLPSNRKLVGLIIRTCAFRLSNQAPIP